MAAILAYVLKTWPNSSGTENPNQQYKQHRKDPFNFQGCVQVAINGTQLSSRLPMGRQLPNTGVIGQLERSRHAT